MLPLPAHTPAGWGMAGYGWVAYNATSTGIAAPGDTFGLLFFPAAPSQLPYTARPHERRQSEPRRTRGPARGWRRRALPPLSRSERMRRTVAVEAQEALKHASPPPF